MAKFEDEESKAPLAPSRARSTSCTSQSSSDSDLSVDSPQGVYNDKVGSGSKNTAEASSNRDRYLDLEDGGDPQADEPFLPGHKAAATGKSSNRTRRIIWALGLLCVGGWVLAFVLFLVQHGSNYKAASEALETPELETSKGITDSGKPVTLDQVLSGYWTAQSHKISWIAGPDGEDGLLLEQGEGEGTGYLRVEDIRSRGKSMARREGNTTRVLMKRSFVRVNDYLVLPRRYWPSPDLKKVLLLSDYEKNWRHSYTGKYWVFDVDTQTAEPLDPDNMDGRVQYAVWSPNSDAIVFVRNNNMYLRKLSQQQVTAITKDGGKELFYGVPDWVYEEEVFSGNGVTWWSNDAKYIAFLRTNESAVPDYPVEYFLSRPSGKKPLPGLENYPEVRDIKYPKPGAPNPTVDLQFYDVEKNEVFSVDVPDDFPADDRIIMEVLWASGGNVIVRVTNRESDILKVFLYDTAARSGKLVRLDDIQGLDGGWVEPSQSTRFIPANAENGRPDDGYIETVIHDGYDHLAYFTPLDNPEPLMLTSGEWEVEESPSAVDLERGLVYFVGTKQSPIQRHVYRVNLNGSDLRPMTDTSKPGYFETSFSHGSGFSLLSYKGPSVPWQAITNNQGEGFVLENIIEENTDLARQVEQHALPTQIFQNVTIDGFTLQVVERRPPHFNPAKKYPVLFHLYNGPNSQTVNRKFTVDFQAYVASNLGYIVVTVDGRGTGAIGRKARCAVRGNLGYYEARDQIETAKIWAKKKYVDESRLAIWGWSYGGFMTLKTIEQDAGKTFQYGMAVAPVTDWRFYGKCFKRFVYIERMWFD